MGHVCGIHFPLFVSSKNKDGKGDWKSVVTKRKG